MSERRPHRRVLTSEEAVIRYCLQVGAQKQMNPKVFAEELARRRDEDIPTFQLLLGISPMMFDVVLARVGPLLPETIDGIWYGPAVQLPMAIRYLQFCESPSLLSKQWGVRSSLVPKVLEEVFAAIIKEYVALTQTLQEGFRDMVYKV